MPDSEPVIDMAISDIPGGLIRVELRRGSSTLAYADLSPQQAAQWGTTLREYGRARMPRYAGGGGASV